MALRQIRVKRVAGKAPRRDGEFFNEFEARDLHWKEDGMAYCWANSDSRILPTRRRQGWKVCHYKDDFLDKGCPEDMIPGEVSPQGTIHHGDSILCKMKASRRAQMFGETQRRIDRKRRAAVHEALGEGEAVAAHLRSRGIGNVGRNLVFAVHPDEERADYNREYSIRTRGGQTLGDGGPPDDLRGPHSQG